MMFSLFVVSCGKKDTAASASDKDTAASVSDEMAAQMGELITTLESAKDKGSAEKAAEKIGKIGDEFVAMAGRLDALGDPSEEDKKLVKEKMDKAEEENEKRMMAAMTGIMTNQEVGPIIMKAMEGFSEKMEGVEDTFKKYGKD